MLCTVVPLHCRQVTYSNTLWSLSTMLCLSVWAATVTCYLTDQTGLHITSLTVGSISTILCTEILVKVRLKCLWMPGSHLLMYIIMKLQCWTTAYSCLTWQAHAQRYIVSLHKGKSLNRMYVIHMNPIIFWHPTVHLSVIQWGYTCTSQPWMPSQYLHTMQLFVHCLSTIVGKSLHAHTLFSHLWPLMCGCVYNITYIIYAPCH